MKVRTHSSHTSGFFSPSGKAAVSSAWKTHFFPVSSARKYWFSSLLDTKMVKIALLLEQVAKYLWNQSVNFDFFLEGVYGIEMFKILNCDCLNSLEWVHIPSSFFQFLPEDLCICDKSIFSLGIWWRKSKEAPSSRIS